MDVRAATWNDNLLLQNSGIIQIAGAQNLGSNNLSIATNSDLSISAAVSGTGALAISTINPATGIGLGNAQTGSLLLGNTEIGFITNGWSSLEFGSSSMSGDMNVGALTWNDNLSLKTGTGILSINGNQNLGANNLTLEAASNPVISGNITGTGILTLIARNGVLICWVGELGTQEYLILILLNLRAHPRWLVTNLCWAC